MPTQFQIATFEFSNRQTLRLTQAMGSTVVCLAGSLWLTRDHCPKDHVLEAGDDYRIESAETVIVQALSGARLRLLTPVASPSPPSLAHPSSRRWSLAKAAASVRLAV